MARLHPPPSLTPPLSPTPTPPVDRAALGGDKPLAARVARVIELIRPAVQADGGDLELVGITPERDVQIRLHGACVGCPSSSVTLKSGIEKNLREHVPEIRGVIALD